MSGFGWRFESLPGGFRVSATENATPVTVTLRPWGWDVTAEGGSGGDGWGGPAPLIGLVQGRTLTDRIAWLMRLRSALPHGGHSPRLREWSARRTARVISGRVYGETKRLLDGVPAEVIDTQRAVFAATFGVCPLAMSELLYQPQYAMLRRDVRGYRAAAAVLAQADVLVPSSAAARFRATPAWRAAEAEAAAAGVTVHVRDGFDGRAIPDPAVLLDTLADGWRGVLSPTGVPYTSLNKTLMQLPGGIPHGMLAALRWVMLPRPVTGRAPLLAVLAVAGLARRSQGEAGLARRGQGPDHLPVFLRADRERLLRAMTVAGEATRRTFSPRRARDISSAVRWMCDYPEPHHGSVTGLARKSARWHHGVADRETAAVIGRVGLMTPLELPPVPLPRDEGVRFLESVGDLAREGDGMQNCAVTYADVAIEGWSYLFHVDHDGESATVEVDRQGRVVQALGPGNTVNGAARWGQRVLARWGRSLAGEPPVLAPRARADPQAEPDQAVLPF